MRLYGAAQDLLLSRLVWFIRHIDLAGDGLLATVQRFRPGIAAVEASLTSALSQAQSEHAGRRAASLMAEGVPETLAARMAVLPALVAAPDVVLVAQETGHPIAEAAATHFAVAARFRIGEIIAAARDVPMADYYDRLALDRALATIEGAHRALTCEVAMASEGHGSDAVTAWSRRRGSEVERILASVEAIASSGLTLSKLTVAASLLGDLARR
jgi:glutamate dehydrogenase